MSIAELKKRIINKIQDTDNKSLLEDVYRLLGLGDEDLEVYKLSEEQIKAIDEAREQIRNEQIFTDEEVNEETDKWLKEL